VVAALVAAGLLAATGAFTAPAAGADGLSRTHSEHFDRPEFPVPSHLPVFQALPVLPKVYSRDPKKEWRSAGQFEPDLSDACARREFRQLMPLRYRAVFKNGVLGVAFGYGLNLFDPKKLAKPDRLYYFHDANSSGCTVMSNRYPPQGPATGTTAAATPRGGR